jgi:hypothetical protein
MTEPAKRTTVVSSVSLTADLSDWLAAQSKDKGLPKSKIVQLALLHYRETGGKAEAAAQ